jgi:predicted PurR-regulated permease PerM
MGYLFINIVVGNLLEPKIMGKQLSLSTFIVFSSMVIWGWIFGFLGMFLAVPLTLTINLLSKNTKEYYWFTLLIDSTVTHKTGKQYE